MKNDNLFDTFQKTTAKQWKQKIQFELNGKDYNETLLTKTSDGITIKPFYHGDEQSSTIIPPTSQAIRICQSMFISDEKTTNHLAKDAIKRGANSLRFTANEPFDIEQVFKNIPASIEVQLQLNFLSESFIKELNKYAKNQSIHLNLDCIGNLAKTGNWFQNLNSDFKVVERTIQSCTNFQSIIQIDTAHYQNAGATCVQQVAYALAHANEYLNYIEEHLDLITTLNFNFKIAIGSNYFFEIAKLKALRLLWNIISEAYSFKTSISIFSEPNLRNKTLYDYNTNMLRTTSECMSAILGGSDTISNMSYDSIFHKKNEFGERISRNQLLILLNEASFDEAKNSSQGAYYIETLTTEIAQKALAIFKDIEKSGGFLTQLKEGTIQRKIKASATKEQEHFNTEELILIGTNRYQNTDDKMKDNIELYPFVKTKPRKTLIEPIIAKRLAEETEQKRLQNEA